MQAATIRASEMISEPIRGALSAACGRAMTATPPLQPPASVLTAGMIIACQLFLLAQSEASGTLPGGRRCSCASTTSASVIRRNFWSDGHEVVLAVAMRRACESLPSMSTCPCPGERGCQKPMTSGSLYRAPPTASDVLHPP